MQMYYNNFVYITIQMLWVIALFALIIILKKNYRTINVTSRAGVRILGVFVLSKVHKIKYIFLL